MKALASDFDNTLYFMGNEIKIKPNDLQAIARFQKSGSLFGICTGRSLKGITHVVPEELKFDFYILASGALVLDGQFREIHKSCMDFDMLEEIYDRYKDEVFIVIQANDTVYNFNYDFPLQTRISSMEELGDADIYGFSIGTESEEMADRIAQEIIVCYGEKLTAFRNVFNVDIVSKECSKGAAMELVREHFGIDSFAGIGDSYNDISMLEHADVAYTFPYAPKKVQECADQIVKCVAEAIECFGDRSSGREG